ncbi:Cell morphogenesis protein PAG1, partial [Linderina macrospora]
MAQDSSGARANPFGNYSFMEAQRSTATPTEPTTPMRIKESPFGNYNFKEAQQQSSSSNVVEPSSPMTTRFNNYRMDDAVVTQNSASIQSPVVPSASVRPEVPTAFEGYSFSEAQGNSSTSSIQQQQQQQPLEQTLQPIDFAQTNDFADARSSINQSGYLYDNLEHVDHGVNTMSEDSSGVEQFVIRALYDEFRDRSAAKIQMIVDFRLDRDPDLARYLDKGVDPVFDRTLQKLGMLARRRPRVIIEVLLVWRKATVDSTDEFPLDGSLPASFDIGRHQQQQQQGTLASTQSMSSRAHSIARDRRSLASVYILCRALVAVVGQLESSHLEGDLGDRLEELVFSQVREVNPANLRRSQNRRDIQNLYVELIGKISEIRFASMSDRFIAELERIPMVSGANDERIVVLLQNMRSLKLRVFPIDALEESSAFLLSCAKFYSRTSGSLRLKHAWATLLTELLMPMAAVVDVEVNMPELVQAIDIIYTKAMKMAAKVRHVNVAFPLVAATLCISRREVFQTRWLELLGYCLSRLKDKQFRRVSVDAILRMLWVYLFRYPENNATVVRRIDSMARIFFPATKLHAWPKTIPSEA